MEFHCEIAGSALHERMMLKKGKDGRLLRTRIEEYVKRLWSRNNRKKKQSSPWT